MVNNPTVEMALDTSIIDYCILGILFSEQNFVPWPLRPVAILSSQKMASAMATDIQI